MLCLLRVPNRLGGRWAEYGTEITADEETRSLLWSVEGGSPLLTPTGPVYEPTGPDDEVALYLFATQIVGAPRITGNPPEVPLPPPIDPRKLY